MGEDVVEDRAADVGLATVVGSSIGRANDEWFVEDVAADEQAEHPLAAGEGGHDLTGVGNAIGEGDRGGLLGLADVFALAGVVGHGATPVMRWSAFCPPPTSVSESVWAPCASFSANSAC